MKIPRAWLLDPAFAVPLAFGTQFVLWIVFLPSTPTTPLGEPKCYDVNAFVWYFLLLAALLIGIRLGSLAAAGSRPRAAPSFDVATVRFLYYVAVALFLLSVTCLCIMMSSAVLDVYILTSFFEAHGSHRAYVAIRDESSFGVPTLSQSWILSCAIFAQLSASVTATPYRLRARIHLLLLGVIVLCYSMLGMTRVSFVNYLLIIFAAHLMARPRPMRAATVFSVLGVAVAFIWLGSTIRTGTWYADEIHKPVLSLDVQQFIWAELAEKYLPGELNNALLIMGYPAYVADNWLYGTMFQRYGSCFSPADRDLNTLNVLGIWYWQFHWGSFVVAVCTGVFLGCVHRRAAAIGYKPSWATTLMLIAYPGVFGVLRINYFFLSPFIIPLVQVAVGSLMWTAITLSRQGRSPLPSHELPQRHTRARATIAG